MDASGGQVSWVGDQRSLAWEGDSELNYGTLMRQFLPGRGLVRREL